VRLVFIDIEAEVESGRPFELMNKDADVEQKFAGEETSEVLHREIRRDSVVAAQRTHSKGCGRVAYGRRSRQLRITVPAVKSRLLRARHEFRERPSVRCISQRRSRAVRRLTPMDVVTLLGLGLLV